jgi:hypothetical protein
MKTELTELLKLFIQDNQTRALAGAEVNWALIHPGGGGRQAGGNGDNQR